MTKTGVAKNGITNKVKNVLVDIAETLIDEPIGLLPLFLLGVVMMPIFKAQDNRKRKRIKKDYGSVNVSLENMGNPTNEKEYLWNIHKALMYNIVDMKQKHYKLLDEYKFNTGFISMRIVVGNLGRFTQNEEYEYFIIENINPLLLQCDIKVFYDVLSKAEGGDVAGALYELNANRKPI